MANWGGAVRTSVERAAVGGDVEAVMEGGAGGWDGFGRRMRNLNAESGLRGGEMRGIDEGDRDL